MKQFLVQLNKNFASNYIFLIIQIFDITFTLGASLAGKI